VSDDPLQRLAERAGLILRWRDYRGLSCETPAENLRRVLSALGHACATPAQTRASLDQLESEAAAAGLPPLLTAEAGEPLPLGRVAPPGSRCELWLEDGRREIHRLQEARGGVLLPGIAEPGYHRLRGPWGECTLAVAPGRCYDVTDAAPGRRPWGLSVQLYALRHPGDAGLGDFRALADLVRRAAGQGADAVALSPVHALFTADLQHFGPYAPSSRLFLNVTYADPDSLGEGVMDPAFTAEGERLEALSLVDWPAAMRLRLARLRQRFQRLGPRLAADSGDPLAHEFAAFQREGGSALRDHARFEMLHALQVAAGCWHWRHWPEPLRHPGSPEVAQLAQEHAEEVRFHLFLQWLAQRGLAAAQAAARAAGMAIGLIGDLAVGTDGGGSHAWSRQQQLLQGLTVGAPPDELSVLGQNWGLTAFSPQALQREGFASFREMLRANLRTVGGLRIDHVFGLERLWLVPEGGHASDGAYLRYPRQDLLRLLALESWRARAIIIGEDLGTVPEGFREAIERAGVLGMRVLWFEREHGLFVAPARWAAGAMATTTTHDLPTVAGWWGGRDLDWRARLRQFAPDRGEAQEREQRARDRQALWAAFSHAGLAGGEPPPPELAEPVIDAAVRYVARTRCALAILPVEDLAGVDEQPNLPGTTDEHPNWRRRLPLPIAELLATPAAQRRLADLRADRSE